MKKKLFLKKITLTLKKKTYLGSGQSVIRLIAKGHDTYHKMLKNGNVYNCNKEIIGLDVNM